MLNSTFSFIKMIKKVLIGIVIFCIAANYSFAQTQEDAPVTIFYGLNESHSNDWAQCDKNGYIGITFYKKQDQTLYFRKIEPNGDFEDQEVARGSNLEVSVLLFDSDSNPHIFVGISNDHDQIITHYYKNNNAQWKSEDILHFNNSGGRFIYELSADLGTDNSFHLLVLKTRSNPDSDDYYYAFVNSNLFYLTNASGSWTKELIHNYNTIPTCDEYVKALNRQDLQIDEQGYAHVVFGKTSENSFSPSHLCYATNKSGIWELEIAFNYQSGTKDEAGWFPSICLDKNGIPSISCTYIPRVPTGSATQASLFFLTRLGAGNWTSEIVTTNDDGYYGTDGRSFTGGLTNLKFDKENKPNIIFTDIASRHSGMQCWNLGNIRYAIKKDNEWNVSTLYSQNKPISFYNATEIYGLCLLIPNNSNFIHVIGQELNVDSNSSYSINLIHRSIESIPTSVNHITNNMELQVFPNPTNSITTINFELKLPSHVRIQVINSNGITIANLLKKELPEGKHSCTFNANQLPKGVYILLVKTSSGSMSKKIIKI